MTKVCVKPTGLHSHAMKRVEAALASRRPKGVEIVENPALADVQVLHVIGFDGLAQLQAKDYAVIQYCVYAAPEDPRWLELWRGARFVWSYYDLSRVVPPNVRFLHAPLGIDQAFRQKPGNEQKSFTFLTSGYSTGPAQEAVQEAALAVDRVRGTMVHIGPKIVEGWEGPYPACWQAQHGINDQTLALLYRQATRVSGLRHVEGFEMPVIEGLACGARPVVFDRPEMRQWYEQVAEFVPECHGEELIDRLAHLFATNPKAVSLMERDWALRTFDWDAIAAAFWETFEASRTATVSVSTGGKRRLLIVGDAGVSTGFAKGTHKLADAASEKFDVHVIGLNHDGDPPILEPYPVYPAMAGGDPLGYGLLRRKIDQLGPACVVIQNDPWNFPGYLSQVGNVPVVGWVAVDGRNIKGTNLAGLSRAVFWTEFGRREAQAGGWAGPSGIVPLGVDLAVYGPFDAATRRAERERVLGELFAERGLPLDAFIVGSIGRNQWRKRLDLTIEYFAAWVKEKGVTDACLWLQSAPTGDDAWDLGELCRYYGVADRVFSPPINGRHGMSEASLCRVYNMMDVLFVTSLGEGFHLPSFEAMACGVPVVAPDWSALGELLAGSQRLVSCTSTAAHPRKANSTIGGVMDREEAVIVMDDLYSDVNGRAELGHRALALARQDRFRWENVGAAFLAEIDAALAGTSMPRMEEPLGV
jgi:D-inositol-3-phosphate glycosyltransferase